MFKQSTMPAYMINKPFKNIQYLQENTDLVLHEQIALSVKDYKAI